MCEMLDRMISKGKIEGIQEGKLQGIQEGKLQGIQEGKLQGIQEGKLQGIQEGKIQMILKMYQNNFTLQQIAMVVEKTVDEVNAIIKEHTLSPS